MRQRPLIAHVVHRFAIGGMENGVVNLINRLPDEFADHAVIALTGADPEFVRRIERPGVRIVELHKAPGQTLRVLPKLAGTLHDLRPTVFHTRNIGTLETQLGAWLARVPVRLHGEHGWDMSDLGGSNRTHLRIRRLMRPFTHHQIALSAATHRYLSDRVGVAKERITNICNGVCVQHFNPPADKAIARAAMPPPLRGAGFVVGAIGRVAPVKNLAMLVDAFALVTRRNARFAAEARLAIVGDGADLDAVRQRIDELRLRPVSWLPGARADVAPCLQAMDILCLPSLAEGISNAILEAMACGLPVVATDVGGNAELISHGETGFLVESQDSEAMGNRIEDYFTSLELRTQHSTAARRRAVTQFSLPSMVDRYHNLYSRLIEERT